MTLRAASQIKVEAILTSEAVLIGREPSANRAIRYSFRTKLGMAHSKCGIKKIARPAGSAVSIQRSVAVKTFVIAGGASVLGNRGDGQGEVEGTAAGGAGVSDAGVAVSHRAVFADLGLCELLPFHTLNAFSFITASATRY